MLKPCQFRNVTDNGELVCAKITRGSRAVSADICASCPAAAINCQHLRFSLEKRENGSLIVRYGNGRTEVWDGEPATVHLQRAACNALCLPLSGTQTCAACSLHSPMAHSEADIAARLVQTAEMQPGRIASVPSRTSRL